MRLVPLIFALTTLGATLLDPFQLGSFARADESVPCVSTRTLELSVSTVRSGAAPIAGYQVWFTTDGGTSWERDPDSHASDAPIRFNAPRDGQYGFIVVPRDRAGIEAPAPQPGRKPELQIIVDTTKPTLEVIEPTTPAIIYAGEPVKVRWKSWDDNFGDTPVRIDWRRVASGSSNAGLDPSNTNSAPWESIGENALQPAEGLRPWWSPVVDGQIELRVTATDRAGNETVWTTPAPVKVVPYDGFRGSRTVAAEPYSQFRKFPIHYRIVDWTPVEIAQIEVWWRKDLGPWQRQTDPNRVSPFLFEVPEDGSYFFYVRVTDHNGAENRPAPTPDTPADARVVVDTHSPDLALRVESGGAQIAHDAGEPIELTFDVRDVNLAPKSCDLHVSVNGGESWQLLVTRLEVSGDVGSFRWRTPLIRSEGMRFKLSARDLAGNRTEVMAPTVVQLVDPMLDPVATSRELYQRGLALARLKDPSEQGTRNQLERALESFDLALLYDAEFADAHHDRGQVLALLGQFDESLAAICLASDLQPGNIPFRFDRVRSLMSAYDRATDSGRGDWLDEAVKQLALVSREQIYNYPRNEYRDLLRRYRILQEDIDSRLSE